ncbi:hypothetical protein D3C79_970860 [compost metagenome]
MASVSSENWASSLTALSLLLPRASITRENRPATLLSLSVTSSNSSAISMASENRLSGSFFRDLSGLASGCWALKVSISVPKLAGVSVTAMPSR